MSHKRLLFIQEDPVLSSIYQDRLELAGYTVDTARNVDRGLQLLSSLKPDLVILDPLLSEGDFNQSITALRTTGSATAIPIIVLPTAHPGIAESAGATQAIRVIERGANPIEAVISRVSEAFGGNGAGSPAAAGQLDPQARQAIIQGAPEAVGAMRQALREATQSSGDSQALKRLLQCTHRFAAQAALLGPNALNHIAAALEVLAFGLTQFPERADPLTFRTFGQALDFLSQVLQQSAYAQPVDLATTHVLIVEDEANARELIITAMDLVGLPADGLDNPSTSLAVLSTQPCDLIFLDINLPDMNGFELCGKLRAIPLHEKTPIIFLTGMYTFQNRVQSNLSGGNDFVGKPFNVAELGVKALIWVLKGQLGLH